MIENTFDVITIICSTFLLAYLFRLCFYSKCSDISLCGLKVHRNTNEENKETENLIIPFIGTV